MKKGEERETGPRFFKKNELTSFEQEYKKAVKSLKSCLLLLWAGNPYQYMISVHMYRH